MCQEKKKMYYDSYGKFMTLSFNISKNNNCLFNCIINMYNIICLC